ncbi:MAG: hypothetical protein ACLSA6_11455 [Holdemania massiliensis]
MIACLNRFDFATEGFDSIFVVGLVLLTYALCSYGEEMDILRLSGWNTDGQCIPSQ